MTRSRDLSITRTGIAITQRQHPMDISNVEIGSRPFEISGVHSVRLLRAVLARARARPPGSPAIVPFRRCSSCSAPCLEFSCEVCLWKPALVGGRTAPPPSRGPRDRPQPIQEPQPRDRESKQTTRGRRLAQRLGPGELVATTANGQPPRPPDTPPASSCPPPTPRRARRCSAPKRPATRGSLAAWLSPKAIEPTLAPGPAPPPPTAEATRVYDIEASPEKAAPPNAHRPAQGSTDAGYDPRPSVVATPAARAPTADPTEAPGRPASTDATREAPGATATTARPILICDDDDDEQGARGEDRGTAGAAPTGDEDDEPIGKEDREGRDGYTSSSHSRDSPRHVESRPTPPGPAPPGPAATQAAQHPQPWPHPPNGTSAVNRRGDVPTPHAARTRDTGPPDHREAPVAHPAASANGSPTPPQAPSPPRTFPGYTPSSVAPLLHTTAHDETDPIETDELGAGVRREGTGDDGDARHAP